MAKIIIEEVNRLGHVTGRHSFDHYPISIGRSYQNDLIVDDPYVSPEHALVRQIENGQETENHWQVEDNQSDNGIKFKLHTPGSTSKQLYSGDEIIIGRTRLRLLSPTHPVAETHLLPTRSSLPKIISQPVFAIATVIIAAVFLLIDAQLSISVKTGFEKLLANSFPTFIFALMWAGIWAFVGRVITHRASFLPHFIAALLVFIISMLTSATSGYLTYNLSTNTAATLLEFVVIGFTIAGLLYINLTNSTSLNKRSCVITSHGVAWSMLLMGLFMQYVNKPDFSHAPDYASQLKPPFAKVVASKSLDEFIKSSEKVFEDHTEE